MFLVSELSFFRDVFEREREGRSDEFLLERRARTSFRLGPKSTSTSTSLFLPQRSQHTLSLLFFSNESPLGCCYRVSLSLSL